MPVGIEWPDDTVLWVLRGSVEATVLAGLVLLVQWLFRDRISARWQFALWWLVVIRLLMPFSVQTPLSVSNLLAERSNQVPESAEVSVSPVQASQSPDSQDAPVHFSPATELQNGEASPSWRAIALWGWLGGALFCGAYVVALTWKRQRQVRSFPIVTDENTLTILARCQRDMGIRAKLEVRQSPQDGMPALYGLSHPLLLLPENLTEELSPEQLRHVFFHELAHLKRWDLSSSWLITGALLAHWFNPFIWWSARRMHADCELAADELALSFIEENENQSYGMTLVTLLERTTKVHPVPGLVGIVETNKPIKRRIRMIARFRHRHQWSALAAGIACTLGVLFLTGAVEPKPKNGSRSPESGTHYDGDLTENERYNATKISNKLKELLLSIKTYGIDHGGKLPGKLQDMEETLSKRLEKDISGQKYMEGVVAPLNERGGRLIYIRPRPTLKRPQSDRSDSKLHGDEDVPLLLYDAGSYSVMGYPNGHAHFEARSGLDILPRALKRYKSDDPRRAMISGNSGVPSSEIGSLVRLFRNANWKASRGQSSNRYAAITIDIITVE